MAWQTPKTTWAGQDAFRLDPDYERIRGNLLYLRQRAAAITQKPGYSQMQAMPWMGFLWQSSFFNQVEENLAALAAAVQPRPEYATRAPLYQVTYVELAQDLEQQRGNAAANLQRSECNRERPAEAGLLGRWPVWHVCFVI